MSDAELNKLPMSWLEANGHHNSENFFWQNEIREKSMCRHKSMENVCKCTDLWPYLILHRITLKKKVGKNAAIFPKYSQIHTTQSLVHRIQSVSNFDISCVLWIWYHPPQRCTMSDVSSLWICGYNFNGRRAARAISVDCKCVVWNGIYVCILLEYRVE